MTTADGSAPHLAESSGPVDNDVALSPWFLPGPRQALAEIVLFWLGVPVLVVAYRLLFTDARAPIIPLLILGAIGGAVLLRRDPTYNLGKFWDRKPLLSALRVILPRFVVLATVMAAIIAIWFPANLFEFPRRRPDIWAVVMVGYPIVSVFAQGVVYRGVFLHRYRGVLGEGWAIIAVGAAIFGLAHVVMLEWMAVAITLVGGLLFTATQLKHRSLLASGLEHAMYGCWAFTVGYGEFLFAGSRKAAEDAARAMGGG